MSVVKSFAHRAHQILSPIAPRSFKRSHVYELMAAGVGFKSWAAMHHTHVLINYESMKLPADFGRCVLARALQLSLSPTEAEAVAASFHALSTQEPFGCHALAELDIAHLASRPAMKSSQMLLDDLADRAIHGDALSHYRLAKLLVCKVPSDYLYQESLRGRPLTVQEQRWVDEYLQLVLQREKFLLHLKAAADGGVRAANLDYAIEASEPSYRQRAVNMTGKVNWRLLASTATSYDETNHWLREAADDGDKSALQELAEMGDNSSAEQLAILGDRYCLRQVTESALQNGNPVEAWKWQLVALHHGVDLTKSTVRAHHDGGSNDGDFYDSDFGGPMYVTGEEGLELPVVSAEQKKTAKKLAQLLLAGSSN